MKTENLLKVLTVFIAFGTLSACATKQPVAETAIYGPLTVDKLNGGDLYVAQDDKFAEVRVVEGTIEFHLKGSPFQIGHNGEQMNICLARVPFDEVRADPRGYKASCLSGAMTGATPANNDFLFVYTGKKWSDGNTELADSRSMKAVPLPGYKSAYQINDLKFLDQPDMGLRRFRGTLYGYLVVYKQHVRMNKDIMPIRLVIE